MRFLLLASALILTACERDETIYSYGGAGHIWQVDTLNGAAFDAVAQLAFEADGAVRGTAPCNSFQTQQTAPYPWVDFGPIVATRRACPELDRENVFFSVLERVTIGMVRDDILTLSNDDGDKITFVKSVTSDG